MNVFRRRKGRVPIRWLALPLAILAFSQAEAQQKIPRFGDRPDLYVTFEDGSTICRISQRGDTTPAHLFSSAYVFLMFNDSASVAEYTFAECRRNGERLPLRNYKSWRTINADSKLLDFNSRTVDITLSANDTLSFFRELVWYDPALDMQANDEYSPMDTLAFSVELVRTTDSLRIALIDSIGMLSSPQAWVPIVHGMRPVIAVPKFIVPSSLHGVTAFLRVRAYAKGRGDYFFTRKETKVVGLSRKLNDAYWVNYLSHWGQVFAKPATARRGVDADGEVVKLDIHILPGTGNRAQIDFSETTDNGSTTVVIYDANEEVVFYPFNTPTPSDRNNVLHTFEKSGIYIIGLMHNGTMVKTSKITIAE